MDLRKAQNRIDRLRLVEEVTHSTLTHVSDAFVDDEAKVHCENLIGAVTIPLGVAGPLHLEGERVSGDYYIPLATTEGALIASVSRGCKAIGEAEGAAVSASRIGVTRGPVFDVSSLRGQTQFMEWLELHEQELKQVASGTSSHLSLKKIFVKAIGRYIYLRCHFDTDQAMGMNMATIATQRMVDHIQAHTEAQCITVAGNFDIDKKAAWLNVIEGRGIQAWADVTIPAHVIEKTLKTSARRIFDVWLSKCMIGSAMSGSLGFNAHFANIVAAFFAATGQDLAHVVEGSNGITVAKELDNGELYFSVYLPSLMVGTVGGGTQLITQNEARAVTGTEDVMALSELLAGAVLAGELSLIASLAEGSLSRAHQTLGR